ncbi:MAG: IS66 family insertion sequence element accessory protein TnpA [Planctomycetota bacterium]|jgi:transposase-like protein
MGRPPSDLDDYLDWQERLESFRASGLSIDEFCLQEGVSRSTFYRWVDRLKDGIPESMVAEEAARKRAQSGQAAFVPITLKASPVEIELPNGGTVRLPLDVGQAVLVEVIQAVGALRPWKAPK